MRREGMKQNRFTSNQAGCGEAPFGILSQGIFILLPHLVVEVVDAYRSHSGRSQLNCYVGSCHAGRVVCHLDLCGEALNGS